MGNIETHGFSFDLPKGSSSIIKVIGVGGGGNNALRYMYERGIHGVDFVICNTDAQALDNNPVSNKVQLGLSMTEGLGAGADPEVGEKAAIESIDDIKAAVGQNTKMVFVTAGMGGGTGTGAAPVIAKVAKEMGILTVGIVTVPFSFEGKRRLEQAELGLKRLKENVDSLIVINNDKLRQLFGNLGFKQGFSKADEVLTNAAKGMAEVITGYFDVNIDFRDAKSVLQNSGTALMSTGIASGENKAEEAVKKALDSPLLNDNKITGAKNVLLLIRSGNEEATMDEIGIINDYIQKEAGNTADIIFGVGNDEELGDAISVLVIATGFSKDDVKHTGITEKINYRLNDSPEKNRRESPFKSKTERIDLDSNDSVKNIFTLEDTDDIPQMQYTSTPSQPTESFSHEEVHAIEEEEQLVPDLFNYDHFEDEEETFSFTFEVDKPVQEEVEQPNLSVQEERPVEIKFSVNEPVEDADKFEIKQKENLYTPQVEEREYESIPAFKPQNEFLAEEEKQEEIIVETKTEEFTFISKPVSNDQKIQERRNKLKEFNSRYQSNESENDFENIPAFKRKNIKLDAGLASDFKINSFMTENENGDISLRENRFLNKDVD